jgi:hypothetical protein
MHSKIKFKKSYNEPITTMGREEMEYVSMTGRGYILKFNIR